MNQAVRNVIDILKVVRPKPRWEVILKPSELHSELYNVVGMKGRRIKVLNPGYTDSIVYIEMEDETIKEFHMTKGHWVNKG